MRKRRSKFPIKIILAIFLPLAGIFFILFFSYNYLVTSDYFKVKEHEYFAGQSIFKVNLKEQAQRLSKLYSGYEKVILKRFLPNKIIVDFIPRQALALLMLSDDFYVDRKGVLFQTVHQEIDDSYLPLIVGLEARIPYPRSGLKCNEDSLQAILKFIHNLNNDSKLAEKIEIKEINLINVNDIFLFTINDCKINLGSAESLDKDLLILQRLISEINSDLDKIEYIDLRFREPVVKYK